MKILSANVNGRVRGALDRQMTSLLERNPDILALQEVTMGSHAGWLRGLDAAGYTAISAVDDLARPYPPPPYPSPPFPPRRRGHIRRKYFNLVAARHPIVMLPGLSFDDPEEALYAFPEKYVAARVTVDGTEIDVHNAHVPPGASRGVIKVHAFEAIRRRVDEERSNPRILCGDFNAPWSENADGPVHKLRRKWPEDVKTRWIAAEKKLIADPEMPDVYRSAHAAEDFPASHITRSSPHRYDYIFASSELKAQRCEYLVDWLDGDRRNGRLSDHAPVEAELSLAG